MRPRLLPPTLVLLLAAPVLGADDTAAIKAALEREILGPHKAMAEVQGFCEDRVPEVPAADSADAWTEIARKLRADALEHVIFRGEAAAWRDAKTKVEWLDTIDGGPGYRIRKLRYEALPGLWIPALLYEPGDLAGKVPVVLNVNGHDGQGKAADYKQVRCINQAKRGMIALNVEWTNMGQLRGPGFNHYLLNAIDLCGTAGIAVHYLAMTRALDLLIAHEHADPTRVAVTGLSGGGWQTIFVSGLDPRVTLSVPVAGYSSFKTRARELSDLGDSEQTPSDLATVLDYTHLTAMRAPRPTLLTFNANDNCCFAAPHALPPLWAAARPKFALFAREANLRSQVNFDPGTHNYLIDNRRALYRMLGDYFYPGEPSYNADELPCDDEVKSADALNVALPDDNADFHSLALSLARDLPRHPDLPTDPDAARRWQAEGRDRLRVLVRATRYDVEPDPVVAEEHDGLKSTSLRLRIGQPWTVPAVELSRGEPHESVILVADEGRKTLADLAASQLADGRRVLALDPFYLGESHIEKRDHLFALLVAAVGERPLGIQASQLAAAARWARARHGQPVTLSAVGPRASLAALVAAAIEPDAVAGLELRGSLGSLKEVIERSIAVDKAPEYFCFGLLESFDIKQLAALVAPRPVRFLDPSDRAKSELANFASWTKRLGGDCDPLAP